jgi:N-acetyl-anhydromuramyl-L-alanine amidase AmpD
VTLTLVPAPIVEAYPAPSPLSDVRTTALQIHAKQRVRKRPWSSVTGICLHQTACVLGERPERWSTVGAHLGVMRSGRVVWMHNFDKNVAHGNGWNQATVGIEIDGLYAGVEGDPSTVWDDPSTARREQGMTLTQEAAEATRQALRWICSEVARNGGKVRALVAHRQASANRRNDPGSAIWQDVALPIHAELGLSDGGVGFKLDTGGGYAIPEAWDPRCKGVPY